MIIAETVVINGREYKRTYSNAEKMIERNGVMYSEAIDPIATDREYAETNIPVETEATEADLKAQAYDILMGVSE